MPNKIEQALTLLNQNKIKKALLVVKKINKQAAQQSFSSLEIEGICLFHEKRYPLAEILLKQALNKAGTIEQKCNTLLNLKAVAYNSNNIELACDYLKKCLALDASVNNVEARLQLCQLSYETMDYDTVIKFAPKLLNLSEHYVAGLFLLIGSYIGLSDIENANCQLNKAISELDTLTSKQTNELIAFLFQLNEIELIQQILTKVEEKFSFEYWYDAAVSKSTLAQQTISAIPEQMIIGENRNVEVLIQTLVNQLEQIGAEFHPLLRIIEENGNLSIKSYSSLATPEKLMSVPLNCMPLLADYEFSVKSEQLIVAKKQNMLNPAAGPIMDTLTAIYNTTNKLAQWNVTYPMLTLKSHPAVLERLLSSKLSSSAKLRRFKTMYDLEQWDELLLKSFFGSREFDYDAKYLHSAGINSQRTSEKGLLSIIDFLNHKTNSSWYEMNNDNNHLEIVALPDPLSKEVFVQYNISDPVITYLIYGFVDINAPWIYSVPTEIQTTSGLSLIILNNPSSIETDTDDEFQHLSKYMPAKIERNGRSIIVSSIIIPNIKARSSLPSVLAVVLKKYDVEGRYLNEELLKREIAEIERQILANNLSYWQNFKKQLDVEDSPKNPLSKSTRFDLDALCGFCNKQISMYMNKSGISLL